MNDYKELLKTLRALCSVKDYEPCEYNLQAAEAIEQLVKERDDEREAADEWQHKYFELAKKCHNLEEERDAARLTAKDFLATARTLKEDRDAAVAEVSLCHYCRSCKHANVSGEKEPCTSCNQCWAGKEKCNWEWKGAEHETD